MLLIVVFPILVLSAISTYIYEQQIKENEQNYLSVAMTFVREIAIERCEIIQKSATMLGKSGPFREALLQKDTAVLNKMLADYSVIMPFLDAVLVVDIENQVFGKSRVESRYDQENIIGQAAAQTMKSRKTWFSEEVFLLEEMFDKSSPAYNRLLVKIQGTKEGENDYLRKALVDVNVIPVFDKDQEKQEVIGAIIILDALNNDKLLPKYFSNQVKEAFLTISIDGIRISSNIVTDGKDNYVGSRSPLKNEFTKVKNGQHFGRQYFSSGKENHIFLDEDVINSQGQVVATMGVGIPESRFSTIISNQQKWILAVAILLLFFMLFLGNRFSDILSRPIVSVINSVRRFGELELKGGEFAHNKNEDEILSLSYAFRELVDKLSKKEMERKAYLKELRISEEKASNLAKELQKNNDHLEFMVNERTEDLQMAIQELKKVDIAKSNFMANIGHELRTPLNIIIGSAELLQERILGELTPRQVQYVQNIDDSGRHLLQLINDVLDISKLAAGKMLLNPESFLVKSVVQQAINGISAMASDKDIIIQVDILPEDFYVTADLHKFMEILYNILSNAVKFTREHGRVDVLVEKKTSTFEVTVKDTGIGIALEDQERVFLEFEQVDSSYARQYEGTGLGLPIVKKLVELHGGNVRLRSQFGVGTEMFFMMPLDVEAYLNRRGQKEERLWAKS